MTYQKTLHEIAPDLNPAGVEASMRVQYGTLCHLPRDVFAEEAKLARGCEAAQPGYLRSVAQSMGMLQEFEAWEAGAAFIQMAPGDKVADCVWNAVMIEMPFSPTVAEHMALAMADLDEATAALEGFSLIGSRLEIHGSIGSAPTLFVVSATGETIRFDADLEWERLMECIDCSHNDWTSAPSEWFCRVCGSEQHEESMQSQHAPRVL